jgi:deoxyribodipyrimidine photo-lyase
MQNTKIIYWIKDDLRISDNPALSAATKDGQVAIIYINDTANKKPRGSAYNWWTYQSLASLNSQIQKKYNCKIHFYHGNCIEILPKLHLENKIDIIYFNRGYDSRSNEIQNALANISKTFSANLLHEPDSVYTDNQQNYKIFTPYWRKARFKKVREALSAPTKIHSFLLNDTGTEIEELGLLSKHQWFNKFGNHWQPGEDNAHQLLEEFISNSISTYKERRNFPNIIGTSSLSPYLAHGEISPVQIWHEVLEQSHKLNQDNTECFLTELGWREFSYHLLYHYPNIGETPLKNEFANFPWQYEERNFQKWQRGITGFPIVDAGMRQLWETGWMHNRVRMIVGSFLTKHLLIQWQDGEKWFWDTLVDADYANNPVSWQWVAGCGTDASPYFRIFNPIIQGKKFDSDATYIKKWVPELSNIASNEIHNNPGILGYPLYMIDHQKARDLALMLYKGL